MTTRVVVRGVITKGNFSQVRPPCIVICIDGPVCITGPDAEHLTPRSAKICGLVLLLITSRTGRRSRRWIEQHLWSTRAPEQASGSLRQALATLRRSLGVYKDAVKGDRQDLWIEPTAIRIITPRDQTSIATGLQIRDPAFEQWLTQQRSQTDATYIATGTAQDQATDAPDTPTRNDPVSNDNCTGSIYNDTSRNPQPTRRPLLLIRKSASPQHIAGVVDDLLNHQVAQNLAENIHIDLRIPTGNEQLYNNHSHTVSIQTTTTIQGKQALVTVKLIDEISRSLLLTRHLQVPANINHLLTENHLYQLAHETSETAMAVFTQAPGQNHSHRHAEALYARAMTELFSFDASRLRVSDELLKATYKINSNPTILAWRAFLRMVMYVERTEPEQSPLLTEAGQLCATALEQAPGNSLVLAIVSQINLFLNGDIPGATRLATDAVNLNTGNAMAHLSLATVNLRSGRVRPAQGHAAKALDIVSTAPNRHWWYMTCCLADFAARDYENAIRKAEYALSYSPGFRPPMRHLYVLYLHTRQPDKAAQIVRRLRKIEPDFSLEMIRNNAQYPAGLLRASALIELPDSKELTTG